MSLYLKLKSIQNVKKFWGYFKKIQALPIQNHYR